MNKGFEFNVLVLPLRVASTGWLPARNEVLFNVDSKGPDICVYVWFGSAENSRGWHKLSKIGSLSS